jgi:hypothetical protein
MGYSTRKRHVGLKTDTKICGRKVAAESVSDKFSPPVLRQCATQPTRLERPGSGKPVRIAAHTPHTIHIDLDAGETKRGDVGLPAENIFHHTV